jgi:hypothetical protein
MLRSSKSSLFLVFLTQNPVRTSPLNHMGNMHWPSLSSFDHPNKAVTGTRVNIAVINKRNEKCNWSRCACVRARVCVRAWVCVNLGQRLSLRVSEPAVGFEICVNKLSLNFYLCFKDVSWCIGLLQETYCFMHEHWNYWSMIEQKICSIN